MSLMTLLAFAPAALAAPWFGSTDLDEDGVRDRDDKCVRIPEIENGYLDEDGCPDVLSGFTAGAALALMIEERAAIVALANGERRAAKNQLTWTDLVPGTEVQVAAALGCQAGETSFVVDERHRKLRLNLEPTLFTDVTFIVRNAFDEAPPSASLRWLVSDPVGCAPAESVTLAGGYGVLKVGRGSHSVMIRTSDGARSKLDFVVGAEAQQLLVDMPIPGGRAADGGRLLGDTVYFTDNSDELDEAALAVVGSVASYLREHADLNRVLVEGHADKRAWAPYNDELSERRAQAVADALVAAGVSAERVRVEGRGEKDPAEDGSSPADLAKNRRVHFIVAK